MLHGKGQPSICFDAVYRPPGLSDEYMIQPHEVMFTIKFNHKPSGFITGDFNLPSINYEADAVPLKVRDKKSCETLPKINDDWDKFHDDLSTILNDYMETDPDSRSVTTNWTTIKCSFLSLMDNLIPQSISRSHYDLPYIIIIIIII